jgi:hypothetical protein
VNVLGIIIRPLVALALFFAAALIGRAILRRIPEGRVKQFLSWRLTVVPELGRYWNFWPAFWLFFASAPIFGWCHFLAPEVFLMGHPAAAATGGL